jgi:hypothetical protein
MPGFDFMIAREQKLVRNVSISQLKEVSEKAS